MLKRISRAISLLLSLAIIYNSMGYMVYFQAMSIAVRNEAKTAKNRSLNNKDLVFITLPVFAVNSESNGSKLREIRIKDKMYDIIDEKVKDGNVIYTCIRDHNEENLLAKARNFNDQSSPSKAMQKPIRSITENIIKTALVSNKSATTCMVNTRISQAEYSGIILLPYLSVEVPPPQNNS